MWHYCITEVSCIKEIHHTGHTCFRHPLRTSVVLVVNNGGVTWKKPGMSSKVLKVLLFIYAVVGLIFPDNRFK